MHLRTDRRTQLNSKAKLTKATLPILATVVSTTRDKFMNHSRKLACTVALGLAGSLALAVPECAFEDRLTANSGTNDWPYTLVDTTWRLPADYAPDDLVALRQAGFDDDRLIRSVVIADLAAMRQAALEAGVPIAVQSAYRSYAYQENTFDYWVGIQGREAALASSARPGHSEHQLGTALDFRSEGGPAAWDLEDWAATEAGAWMLDNSWRYGFVLSYPKDASHLTCYIYEPWHYRYLGRERARTVHESGLTLREFLWQESGGER